MAEKHLSAEVVVALKSHYAAIKALQDEHGITAKGDICTWYPYSDDLLLVEADGLGGGSLMLVSDHYPRDGFDLRHSHEFVDEDEACEAAEWFDTLLEETQSTMSATAFFRLLEAGRKPWKEAQDVDDWLEIYDDEGDRRPEVP